MKNNQYSNLQDEVIVVSDKTITTGRAYIIIIFLTLFLIIVFISLYAIIWGISSLSMYIRIRFVTLIIFLIIFIILGAGHELLHAIGLFVFGKVPWSKIKIGIKWKALLPYAHCSIPVRSSIYRISLLLPNIILGFIPLIVGLAFKLGFIYTMGAFMIMGGLGDFIIIWLIRSVSPQTYVKDHPDKMGCEVVSLKN